MGLNSIDWIFVFLYLIILLGLGFYSSRKQVKSRGLTETLGGVVLSADLPLVLTALVWTNGLAGCWLWWSFALTGLITLCFFTRLWRKSGATNELQLIKLRYSGSGATILQGLRVVYMAGILNCLIIGWIILAGGKFLNAIFPVLPEWSVIIIILLLIDFYLAITGVLETGIVKFIQFVVIMVGSLILAGLALNTIGGITALEVKLSAVYGDLSLVDLFPVGSLRPVTVFFVYVALLWWVTWYPGAEPGGAFAQPVEYSGENEKHHFFIGLGKLILRYILCPWPWILIGMVGMVVFPRARISEPEMGFLQSIFLWLPPGLKGILITGFFIASISIIGKQLTTGASYLAKDLYKRFLKPKASPHHYLIVYKGIVLILTIGGGIVAYGLKSVSEGWELLLTLGAGTGLVYLLRWGWWRVNAISEISAMFSALILCLGLKLGTQLDWAHQMALVSGGTTLVWLVTTLCTAPSSLSTLVKFYKRVEPNGWWGSVKKLCPESGAAASVLGNLYRLALGGLVVYGLLFGSGSCIFTRWISGSICFFIAGVALSLLWMDLKRRIQ